MDDKEFDRLASKIDWGDAEDCDSPYTQEFLDEIRADVKASLESIEFVEDKGSTSNEMPN